MGSASATGSVGERATTWASANGEGSEGERMSVSEDAEMEDGAHGALGDEEGEGEGDGDGVSSAGLSDEGNGSLVGFGEGAGSTVSGNLSTGGRSRGGVFARGGGGYAGGSAYARGFNGGGMTGTETAERIVRERGGVGYGERGA